jgi:Protein of unknown function (DUF3626)
VSRIALGGFEQHETMDLQDVRLMCLTNAQQAAWRHIGETVRRYQAKARASVAQVLSSAGCPESLLDAAIESVRQHARVVLHFHPDRIGVKPITVADALLEEGQYRSQFETGLSSGSLTAFPGGARDAWEKTLFGGAYHGQDSSIGDRPKYGASKDLALPRANPSNGAAGRVLDTGIEAQVHGPIDLERDVESLIVDPAFAETQTGDCLRELGREYAFPLEWHRGFRLAVRDVPDEFRGPGIPRIARRIMGEGVIDAAAIGAAQRSLRLRPEDWREWGTHGDTLEHLKQLWHVLVHYGEPAVPAADAIMSSRG